MALEGQKAPLLGALSLANGITSVDTAGFSTTKTIRIPQPIQITPSNIGIEILSSQSPLDLEVRNSLISGAAGATDGITGSISTSTGASNVTIEANDIENVGTGIQWTIQDNTTMEITGNDFDFITGSAIRVTKVLGAAGSPSNVTMSFNRETNASFITGYQLGTAVGGDTTAGCGTIASNDRDNHFLGDITIDNWAGPLNTLHDFSAGAASLMATNFNLNVIVTLTPPAAGPACPLPP